MQIELLIDCSVYIISQVLSKASVMVYHLNEIIPLKFASWSNPRSSPYKIHVMYEIMIELLNYDKLFCYRSGLQHRG